MPKHNKHIDDLFKDGFENAELPLAGGEWDAIFGELHPTKKRKVWWIWLLLPALLTLGGVIAYIAIEQHNIPVSTEAPEQNRVLVETESSVYSNIEKNVDSNESPMYETQTTNNNITETALSTKQQSTAFNDNDNNMSSKTTKENSSTRRQDSELSSPHYLDKTRKESVLSTKVGAVPTQPTEIAPLVAKETLSPFVHIPISVVRKQVSIPVYNRDEKDQESLLKNDYPFSLSPGIIDITPSPFSPRLQVGILIGGANNNQSISSQNQSTLQQYREQNEASTFTPNIELLVRKEYKGILWSSGLGYHIRAQNINSLTYQLYDSIPFLNPDGDTVRFLPFNFRDTTLADGFASPRYSYVSIPFAIGKRFNLTPKWSTTLNVSTSLNILTTAKGNTTNSQGRLQAIEPKQLNRILWNGGAGLTVGYTLNRNFELNIGTMITRDFSNTYKINDVKQRMTVSNIRFGIMYNVK